MSNYFTVDVLTPEKVIAKDVPANSLFIPTIRGQINVLPDHTHIITKLSTGELTLFGGADDPNRYFTVTHGICKVQENKITILSHTSEEKTEIDLDRAKQALENATKFLEENDTLTMDEVEKYRRKVERAKLRIQLCESSKK